MIKRIIAITICLFSLLPVMAKANDDSVLTVENSQTLLEVPINISTVEINGADIVIDRMVVNDNVNLYINNTTTIGEYYQLSGETRIFLTNNSILYLNSYKGNYIFERKYFHKIPRWNNS